jgi:hypothetical protein
MLPCKGTETVPISALGYFYGLFGISGSVCVCGLIADWGEAGYIRIKMGGNVCGIADMATYPLL